jgi:3-deoxy-D-manno-octulosonic acid kinase
MEANVASLGRQPFRDAGGQGSIVFDPTRLSQAGPILFSPGSYGDSARMVLGQGGRGSAWFVRGEFGAGVLRHYRRGGWMARLSDDAFLWRGEAQVRSFKEFALLVELTRAGLPVPAPVAAYYRRARGTYRAAILVTRIYAVANFAAAVSASPTTAPWSAAGKAIAQCHRARAHHADLNGHNLLVDGAGEVHIIDWDKGRIEPELGSWCRRSLDRLERSLRKHCPGVAGADIAAGMGELRGRHDLELRA